MKRKAIFFDRDGTLIIDKIYLNDPDQITYLPEVFRSLANLRDAGYVFVVVTNQSGVPRGLVTEENLREIHRRMTVKFSEFSISFVGFYYAPYSVESNHPMRKPNPGMLLQAAGEHDLDLSQSWMVGDRMSDVEAGYRSGCRTVLITGTEQMPSPTPEHPTVSVSSVAEACSAILQHDLELKRILP